MTIEQIIEASLIEDIGSGDHTSLACIPTGAKGKAHLIAKQSGIISGLEIAEMVAKQTDERLSCQWFFSDGDRIAPGDIVGEVTGLSIQILSAERLMLNILQRMSGIATKTRKLVDMVAPYGCGILDTRKTTPLLRVLEKLAVTHGKGINHRMGLYDMMMIKDNHTDFAGGIAEAIKRCQTYLTEKQLDLKIVVEARNLTEVQSILNCTGVHRILLDNFTPEAMKEAVALIGERCQTEASGGITEQTITDYAATGVNYISVGALTHSYDSLDLSLKAAE